MCRAIFIDRDGVINENRPDYVKTWAEFHFMPRALEGLKQLAAGPRPLVGVTNQSVVGRGIIAPAQLSLIHDKMAQVATVAGGRIDAVSICSHHPNHGCDCRKPAARLQRPAAAELNIDLHVSVFIGDSLSDVSAARTAGAQPILVRKDQGGTHLKESATEALLYGCLVADDNDRGKSCRLDDVKVPCAF